MTARRLTPVVLLLLFVLGCGRAPDVPEPASPFAAPADVSLTADELGKEQNNDEKSTHQKYRGKVIELTGLVRSIQRNLSDGSMICLTVAGDVVHLYVECTEKEPWTKALPGQRVKLKTLYDNRGRGTLLYGGPLLEVTGTPTPAVTAEDLGKAFDQDIGAARRKYVDDHGAVIVTGEVSEVSEHGTSFHLNTGGKRRIECTADRVSCRGLSRGMRVTVTGHCWGIRSAEEANIQLVDCLVLNTTP